MLSNVTSKKHGGHFTNRYANCTRTKKIIGAVINTETNVAKSGRWPILSNILKEQWVPRSARTIGQ
jgi:hypothetical protein